MFIDCSTTPGKILGRGVLLLALGMRCWSWFMRKGREGRDKVVCIIRYAKNYSLS
jgi:hypothetical protein